MRFARLASSLFAAALLLAGAAAAQDTTAASSAYGESVAIHLVPLLGGGITVGSGPLPAVSAAAPPAADVSRTAASISVSTVLTGRVLSTGLLIAHAAASPPDGDSAAADATVDHLDVALLGVLPLLTLEADVVRATASAAGPCSDGAQVSGGTTLANLRIGGTLGLGLHALASPAPNTVLLNAAGIRVVLNEQTMAIVVGVPSLSVNAIHISLDALPVAGLGLATGDIVISHADAQLACAPSTPPTQ
jgi:hypothetical protein